MSQLDERIAQFRKMANDDPDNELGHFRLGQLLLEAEKPDEAAASFRRTIELSPQFSKAFQLLGVCLVKANRRDEAVKVLREGFAVADERGDTIPRDDMVKALVALGEQAPVSQKTATGGGPSGVAGVGGFRCQCPGCRSGARARQLAKPPFGDEIGKKVYEQVCADCWENWFRNQSIKVINELRLDLSSDFGQAEYDKHMREFLGFEE